MVYKADLILISLLVLIWISWLFGFRAPRSLNHAVAYSFTVFFYYFLFRVIIRNERISSKFILNKFTISAILCCSIIILDWVLINLFNIGIRDYFVNVENNSANMLYFQRAFFYSVGGVAEEPGSMALLLNIVVPLGLLNYSLDNKQNKVIWLSIAYILALFCLFSTAGIINAIVAAGLMMFYNLLRSKYIRVKLSYIYITILGFTGVLVLIIKKPHLFANVANEVNQKLFLSTRDASASIRTETWHSSLRDWQLHPVLGNGPGFGVDSYGTGYHSVYLTLLADVGVFALALFILFLFIHLLQLLQLPKSVSFFTGVALIATILHFAVVGDFYHAPFWILLILIRMLNIENKSLPATSNENINHYSYL
ncbi:O-antigen ligase-like membrane protein [Pontibacter ummariensis]|uniref:O-Antigen ligase n=2 Tax=Pontibacter ummariensis TaxID=1610492 RepID=A0A239FCK1_9BACT|nr:O-antigen ligase-like membrane protein [Pontibacter ummariensis]SNS54780.1 O-Antigen ligase [Pontibacter ummariensis]